MRPTRPPSRCATCTSAPVTAAVCDFAGEVRARFESRSTSPPPIRPPRWSTSSARSATGPGSTGRRVRARPARRVRLLRPAHRHHPPRRRARLEPAGLVAGICRALGTHIGVDNDVNLAAIAERARGTGQGVDGFALLWIGQNGLGLAIDIGGTLIRGARGGAGEIGYMPLSRPTRRPEARLARPRSAARHPQNWPGNTASRSRPRPGDGGRRRAHRRAGPWVHARVRRPGRDRPGRRDRRARPIPGGHRPAHRPGRRRHPAAAVISAARPTPRPWRPRSRQRRWTTTPRCSVRWTRGCPPYVRTFSPRFANQPDIRFSARSLRGVRRWTVDGACPFLP